MPRPKVMGIVNVTPDSFSDGGRLASVEAAVAHGLALVEQGADVLDIGGESTRPGAAPVSEAEEIARTIPVIEGLRAAHWAGPISIDTMKPVVARAAAAVGATMWNDVTALGFAPDSLTTAAELGCEVVLMHMRGEPQSMQADPRYGDVVAEVCAELAARVEAAMAAGVARERIVLDPGIGFGKTHAQSFELIRRLPELKARFALPVLLGASRKRCIGVASGVQTAGDRVAGSVAAHLYGAMHGADIVRVHDVAEHRQALGVLRAIQGRHGDIA